MGPNGHKWVLADGRAVVGSMYETVTGNTHVPDLRGSFLRMAGQNAKYTSWNGGNINAYTDYKTARSRSAMRASGSGTTAGGGQHNHDIAVGYRGGWKNAVTQTSQVGSMRCSQ